ncbi:MAG: restriction endonuclease subunit S [Syntrophales bacterium]|nr:restriction endonuclease subunit S [Syntrophales bacterium]
MKKRTWSYVKLGEPDYFKVIMGQSPSSRSYNDVKEGISFFQGKADFGTMFPMPRKYCTEPNRIAETSDVLISVRAPVGPTNMADQRCCIGRGLAAIRCKDRVLPRFLLYAIRSIESTIAESVRDQGGGFTAIRKDQLKAFEIPIPPLDEQRRIVARIEELTCRADEVRRISMAREKELDVLLQSAYSRMITDVEWKPLSQVASIVRRGISVRPEEKYEEMGIRSFGKGTFKKPVLTGKQIGNKRIYRIHESDLVFNNVFAWEGAIAVAQEEDQDRVGSHRFITYVSHEGVSTSEFLCHHFLSERGVEDIRAASPGSAGRNRTLGLKKLEQINVPVPHHQEQKRFAEMAKRRRTIRWECASIEKELKIFQSALLAKAFRGEL